MARARPSVSSFSLRTERKYSSFSSRAMPRGGLGSGGSWKGSPEGRGREGGTWATGASPPLCCAGWAGAAAPAGDFPDPVGGGGGAGGPGGGGGLGGGGDTAGGGGGGRLRGEGFVPEVQILKRIDVFRCAGHRLAGQTTCPSGVSPKAASPTRPHPTCPPA